MNIPTSPELLTGVAAAIGAVAVLARKIVSRRKAARESAVTRAEFKTETESIRHRVTASHRALTEELRSTRKEVLAAIAEQGSAFERRIDLLEANMARMDERTKAL